MDYNLRNFRSLIHKMCRSKIFFWIELISSGLLGIFIVFPSLLVLLGLNVLLRLCQRICLWLVYGDEFQLSPDEIGSNYTIMSKQKRHTILYLAELEEQLDVQTVRENFQRHVIDNKVYVRLTQIWQQKWLYTCLKRCKSFNINNHIRVYPGTENRPVTEKELMQEILPDLTQDMTDLDKPQWELVIIPMYEEMHEDPEENSQFPPTKSLKIIRIHHSYMDAASTLIMIANTFSGEGKSFPYVIDPCKPLKISKISAYFYKLTSLALMSSSIIQNLLRPLHRRPSRFALSRSDKPGELLFSRTSKIPISLFQSIKEKSGVSMPAIVSTVLSKAIRNLELRYPDQRSSKKSDYEKQKQPVWLVAGMFPYNESKPCNEHVAIETVMDVSDISGCELLSLMNDDLGRLAKNPLVTTMYWQVKMIGRSPTLMSKLCLDFADSPALLSNIPLCTRNIKMWGKECTAIMGWVPLIVNSGLGVTSVRFNDHFRYCVQADSSVMGQDELNFFVSQLEHQVDELYWETSLLERKIANDVSLFARDNDVKNGKDTNDNSHGMVGQASERKKSDRGRSSFRTKKNSFIYKLNSQIEQIKGKISKIKEH